MGHNNPGFRSLINESLSGLMVFNAPEKINQIDALKVFLQQVW